MQSRRKMQKIQIIYYACFRVRAVLADVDRGGVCVRNLVRVVRATEPPRKETRQPSEKRFRNANPGIARNGGGEEDLGSHRARLLARWSMADHRCGHRGRVSDHQVRPRAKARDQGRSGPGVLGAKLGAGPVGIIVGMAGDFPSRFFQRLRVAAGPIVLTPGVALGRPPTP
jgi:hypothetical protein